MIESIVLDILLVLVVLLMMAIGAYRGGMREAFSAAGLVLGILIAQEWVDSWGGWIADNSSLTDGSARLIVAVACVLVITAAVGYGVGSSFNYHPGPGGRMYGAVVAGCSALVAMSYVLDWLRRFQFDGEEPEVVAETIVARFLDGGAGVVLLSASAFIVAASLFGAFVRERDDDAVPTMQPARHPGATGADHVDLPEKMERAEAPQAHGTQPVRVRAAEQWNDRAGAMPGRTDRLWSNTWPSDAPGIESERHTRTPGDVQQARERRGRRGNEELNGR